MRVLSWVTMTLPWVMDLAPGCDRVGAWLAGLSLAMARVGRTAAAPSRAWRRSTGALRDMASPVWVEYGGNGFSVVIKSPGVLDVIDAPGKQPEIHRNSRRNQPELADERSVMGWPVGWSIRWPIRCSPSARRSAGAPMPFSCAFWGRCCPGSRQAVA